MPYNNPDPEEIIQNISEEWNRRNLFEGNPDDEMVDMEIENIRRLVIDKLDAQIIKKIKARQQAANLIQEIKNSSDVDAKDPGREDEIKMYLVAEYPELENVIHHLWDYLFERST